MKNVKRLIAGMLAALMMITSVPAGTVYAAEDIVEEETVAEKAVEEDGAQDDDADVVEAEDNGDEDVEIDEDDVIETFKPIEDVEDDVEIVTNIETTVVDNEEIVDEITETVSDEDEVVETEVDEYAIDVAASVDYDAIEAYVVKQLLAERKKNPKASELTIDVSSYKIPGATNDDMLKLDNTINTSSMKTDYGMLYFLTSRRKPTYQRQQNIVTKITYSVDANADDAAFQKSLNTALATVNNNMSDFQKIVVLHDYLVMNCEYDKTTEHCDDMYGALVEGLVKCDGYANTYKYLLEQVGVECYLVRNASESHRWNLVKLDGEYYHIDITNDDVSGKVSYWNLLTSDIRIPERDKPYKVFKKYGEYVDIKATSTKYDEAEWKRDNTKMKFDDEPKAETYTITYVLNGGTNSSENPSSYVTGTAVAFKDPTREGYTFDGWYLKENFRQIIKTITARSSGDITVYAKWIEIETPEETAVEETTTTEETPAEEIYTITYVLNGGINNSENPATYVKGTAVTFKDPTREGYQFDGWYLKENFRQVIKFITTRSSGDMTIYAKWIEIETAIDDESSEMETTTIETTTIEEPSDVNTTIEESSDNETTEETPETPQTTPKAPKTFKVTFNTNGRGKAPAAITVDENSTIVAPTAPTANGYRFDGWYKNAACTKVWNFETDTVQANTTLYAKWTYESNADFDAKSIADVIYTGNACKPEVSVYDEDTLLTVNKDYTVKYYNNVNANVGGVLKNDTFNAALPYVEIIGKGNYAGTVKVNFNILRASISDGNGNANADITLKVTDSFATSNKAKKPFASIKMNKAMKENVDFTVRLTDSNDKILSNATIPAGLSGTFTLEIIGKGNYEGAIERTIYVGASIPTNTKFTTSTIAVSGITDKVYTGKALVQENAMLTYAGRQLVQGVDYTVAYAKNVNKGTATVTFKGIERAGFSGSFKKTFKITAADITSADYNQNLSASYAKAGAKPVVTLTMNGRRLANGKDYTVSYANNKTVGSGTVIVKGKGNYAGTLQIPFSIVKADLNDLTVKTVSVAYNAKKAADYAYRPVIKLMDGKTALKTGVDYQIEYQNNTQAAYDAYGNSRMNAPCAVITEAEGSPYKLDGEIVIPLPIYQNKFTKNTVSVKVEASECVYTGRQVRPSVEVRYMGTVLTEGEDYMVSYGTNNASGKNKGSITISGIGSNYGGDVVVKFDINRKQICY